MSFTDRFIEIPIVISDSKLGELTGNDDIDEVWSYMKLNPFDISRYYPSTSTFQEKQYQVTQIIFKAGEGVICYLPTPEFEKLLNTEAYGKSSQA
jgi:hypothetical protein